MQPTLIKALVGASLTFVPGMVAARHVDTNASAITVNGGATSLQQWNARVSQSLDANLTYPKAIGRSDYPEGAVRVAFHCSENGSPDGVSIVQSSHSSMLDQTALNAVKQISTLHPLPDGIGHDRPMEAWVFFASDPGAIDKMKKGFARQLQLTANTPHPQGEQSASLPPLVIASR